MCFGRTVVMGESDFVILSHEFFCSRKAFNLSAMIIVLPSISFSSVRRKGLYCTPDHFDYDFVFFSRRHLRFLLHNLPTVRQLRDEIIPAVKRTLKPSEAFKREELLKE